ncbi:FAD-dependent oxidoreductase [Nakamurella silvestris]|nr:FAD-dependent oxidoreductase [Nakamurella silvestris]
MTAGSPDYRALSLWLDGLDEPLTPRSPLDGDQAADVAIVGAGFTGLWTAYYLSRADPTLRIVVLESEIAGFGASGRNGGWCSDLFPASSAKIARSAGHDAAVRMRRTMRGTIDEVERAISGFDTDCAFERGGTVALARSAVQWQRAQEEAASVAEWGDTEADLRLLDAAETAEIIGATDVLGATYTPHCAAIDPGRLVRGLARAVEAGGVRIFEQTHVDSITRGAAVTARGTVRAEVVIRATEAYTAALPGARRELAPVYSLITATEPLTEEQLSAVGLAGRATFTDYRHLISYGQRTADGRLVFGGRGAPYHFGSRTHPEFDSDPRVFDALQHTLVQMFPVLEGVRFTHTWGGPLGVPRDWHASVGFDRESGFGWAGGYVGDGVATTNLAGRTLADLITGVESDLTSLPWVGHRSRRWEPEPLRWLGVNAGLRVMTVADRAEDRTGRSSWAARSFGRLLGQ